MEDSIKLSVICKLLLIMVRIQISQYLFTLGNDLYLDYSRQKLINKSITDLDDIENNWM